MALLLFIAPAACAAVLSFLLTPAARLLALRLNAVDLPGPRKIHSAPTPRLGGLAVVGAVVAVLGAIVFAQPRFHSLSNAFLLAAAAGVLPIVTISVFDDIRSRGAMTKLAFHLTGAVVAVMLGIRLKPEINLFGNAVDLGWLAIPISILWLAGITNAFNLVDGLDGLSAGLALISSVSLAAVSIVTGHTGLAAAAAVLAGALLGFLPFNLYPARDYLGDTGATAIGFFLGCLTLSGGSTTSSGLAVTLPIVVLGVPIADTVISMLRRFVKRLNDKESTIFAADREHFHHRLLALGLDHRRAVITLYGAGLLLAGAAFASLFMKRQDAGLLLVALLVAAIVGVAKLGYDEFAVIRSGVVLRFYNTPVLRKNLFVVFVDLAMVIAAMYAAIGIKYDDWSVTVHRDLAVGLLPLLPLATLSVFAGLRIYKRAWGQANIDDIVRATLAGVSASALGFILARVMSPVPVSSTFFITYTLVLLIFVVGTRASYRLLYHWNRKSNRNGEPVVIYGAGKGGELALREIIGNADVAMKPVGFIDDDLAKQGRFVNGYPVLGTVNALEWLSANGQIRGVVLSSEKIAPRNVQLASLFCTNQRLWIRRFRASFHEADWPTSDLPAADEGGPSRRDVGLRRVQ